MYEANFRLNGRPFLSAPRVDRYYPAAAIESCRQMLTRCIDRAEGVGLLVGPSGTGKTLLLNVLADHFRRSLAVALLSNCHFNSRRALLQAILFQLNLPYRGLDEGELRLMLVDHLTNDQRAPRGMLLLIDEAHTLPARLLEEVRMITNLAQDGIPRVRLVLAGNAAIEERLASPKLASLAQRITARAYLESLDAQETEAYICAQLAAVGGLGSSVFAPHALRAVYHATDGVPRLINQLCDHALVMAFAGGRTSVDSDGIQEAWADLQQLPTPWNEASTREQIAIARKDDVVEFGTLDGDDLEPTIPHPARTTVPLSAIISQDIELDDDDEFIPAVVTKPEAELLFGPSDNPLAETFAEEEVVFDRYASADSMMNARQRVMSNDGSLWAAMLDPFTKQSANKLAASAKAAEKPVTKPTEVRNEAAQLSPTSSLDLTGELHDVEMMLESAESLSHELDNDDFESGPHVFGAAAANVANLKPLSADLLPEFKGAAPAKRETPEPSFPPAFTANEDVIIIEDDPRAVQRETATVRRQEYAQLFARLRNG